MKILRKCCFLFDIFQCLKQMKIISAVRILFLIWYFLAAVVCLFWNILSSSSKKTESPFESRPKLARTNSFSKKKPELSSPEDSGVSSAGNSGVIRIDYNPSSGVTFRENKTSNVQVVGKGYSEDQENLDRRVSVGGPNTKVRDRRRMQKGRNHLDTPPPL